MKISIVVPVYNKRPFLEQALTSLLEQTYQDIEIVIVDDGSTDGSQTVAQTAASCDPRVAFIQNECNFGTLIARKRGTLASTGEYVTYLDPDDELEKNACALLVNEINKEPVDILHFGVKVIGDEGVDDRAAADMETFMTPMPRSFKGSEILDTVFSDNGFDWNLAHKLFKGSLIRDAMKLVPDVHMTQAEDALTFFVAAHAARSYRAVPNSPWYLYHFGRGVSATCTLTLERFENICRQDALAVCLTREVAGQLSGEKSLLSSALEKLEGKMAEHTMNEWADHVAQEDKRAALACALRHLSPVSVAAELYRFLRDVVYEQLQSTKAGKPTVLGERRTYLEDALNIMNAPYFQTSSERFNAMRDIAQLHIRDLETLEQRKRWDSQRVRIFVTTHKNVDTFESDVLQPVQVGDKSGGRRFTWTLHDDDGENISELNPMYCELTTQYWAWKNVDADYYGFCHYRRYFDFSPERHEENSWGEIMDSYVNEASQHRYCLDDESICCAVEGFDVITTEFKDLRRFPSGGATPIEHYRSAVRLHYADLEHVIEILKDMHPDYAQDADEFLNGNVSCFCNMFVMRKAVFQAYCAWLFPILERFVQETDMSHYSQEALRTPGHLSERLFNIYYRHQMRTGCNWKTKQVQCVHFEHPEKHYALEPLCHMDDCRPVVPVVFASDNNYVPMLTTTIYSALKNASKDYLYDITVLERNISGENQERMQRFFQQFENVRLQFYNVAHIIGSYELRTSNEHISIETYYRFLIQEVLPFYNKVLYLDSDLIVKGDIAELFNTDLGNNLLAATHDVDYLGNLNMPGGERMRYSTNILGMSDPYAYFQAGVLVLNTSAMRQLHTVREWLEIASKPSFIYDDQDVLNAECEGRVSYLDYEWNVMIDCAGRIGSVFSFAPAGEYAAFLESRSHEKIVHYAGFEKPWKMTYCDRSELYWSYARETPYYEKLLGTLSSFQSSVQQQGQETMARIPQKAMSEGNPLRRILDPLMPLGTNRREVAKAIGRAIRGRN